MLELFRIAETTRPDGTVAETLGWLSVRGESPTENGRPSMRWSYDCRALELPYRDNKKGVSCLPAGDYVAEIVHSSPQFNYPHIWVHDTDSIYAAGVRKGVKIHVANYVRELRGCIAVGERFVDLDPEGTEGHGVLDVTSSEKTLNELMHRMGRREKLRIRTVTDLSEAKAMAPAELETLGADSAEGKRLAGGLLQTVTRALGTKNRGLKPRIGWPFLSFTEMPAVICEPGFGSNPSDAWKLTKGQMDLLRAYRAGIAGYFEETTFS